MYVHILKIHIKISCNNKTTNLRAMAYISPPPIEQNGKTKLRRVGRSTRIQGWSQELKFLSFRKSIIDVDCLLPALMTNTSRNDKLSNSFLGNPFQRITY